MKCPGLYLLKIDNRDRFVVVHTHGARSTLGVCLRTPVNLDTIDQHRAIEGPNPRGLRLRGYVK